LIRLSGLFQLLIIAGAPLNTPGATASEAIPMADLTRNSLLFFIV